MHRLFILILYLSLIVIVLGAVINNRDRKRMEQPASGHEHQQTHHGGQGWNHLVGQHSDVAIESIRKERPDLQIVKVPKVRCIHFFSSILY